MDKKISVMLVDDYYIVREDLKTLVDWEGLGFRICCEAINGKQGLELFQKYRPQLVITDIKMPVMNGLEMAQEILSMYPKVCVILLTAYDEFDLARNALGMGITHYLLKHEIGEANLTELLVKIRTQLSKAQESRRKSIEEQIRGSLMGTLPSKSGEDSGEEFLNMEKSIFSFVLFRGRNGLSGDTLRELASRQGDSVSAALLMESHGVFTFLFESKLPSELAYYSGVSNFISQIKAGLGEDVDVAVSKRLRERKSIREIYRRALDSLEISVFHKEAGQIIWCEVAPPCREIDHAELYQFMAQIKTLLSERNYGQAYLVVEDYVLKKCIPEKRIDQFRLQKTFLIGLLEEHNGRHHFLEQAQVDTLKSPEDTAYGFLEKLKGFTEQMAQADGRNLSRNVRKAVAYIMENYQDAITLEDVAEEIGVSAMYAGQLFKKEMGVSFKRYLSEARVEKAKELLRSGNYRIYEVSRMTGYQTTQYFCNVFKKVTGISPGEFMEYENKEQEK
jgi:two-component system response regulator YesN